MELNIEQQQQLEKLLAKPSLVTQEHIPFLQNLIDTYPYYQPLHLLFAKAANGTQNQHQAFTKAALYNNGSILHRVIYEPQKLTPAEDINIITYQSWNNTLAVAVADDLSTQHSSKPLATTTAEAPEIENIEPLANDVIPLENELSEDFPLEEKNTAASIFVPEIENLAPLESEVIKVCEMPAENEQSSFEADEQEVFDEISEIIAPANTTVPEAQKEIVDAPEIETLDKGDSEATYSENILSSETAEKEPITETFASTNFFVFDNDFSSETIEEAAEKSAEITNAPLAELAENADEHIVSKYDDDQLPFTFLWWLAKTRKDHEQIFRPFTAPARARETAQAQNLQQQYVENIFHMQTPFEPAQEDDQQNPAKNTKESKIIDSFIKNDPQIKALPPNQINNENKAKKSAEDSNDLVSETLAQIYIEQMLYHKAIDTYQKLSLKFPEKSGYFADLIQSLEKKI